MYFITNKHTDASACICNTYPATLQTQGASSDFAPLFAVGASRAPLFTQLDALLTALGAKLDGLDVDWVWGPDDFTASAANATARAANYATFLGEVYARYSASLIVSTCALPRPMSQHADTHPHTHTNTISQQHTHTIYTQHNMQLPRGLLLLPSAAPAHGQLLSRHGRLHPTAGAH